MSVVAPARMPSAGGWSPVVLAALLLTAFPLAAQAAGKVVTIADPGAGNGGQLYLRPGGPHPLFELSLDVDARDIAADDSGFLYLAAGDDGLVVLKRDGVSAPRRIARLSLDDPATMIRLAGETAWIGGPNGLVLVDISIPDQPRISGRYPTPAPPADLHVGDSRAWLLLSGELLTLDHSIGGIPILIARNGLEFDARAIIVDNNQAFLAAGEDGMITFDVRKPPPLAGGYVAGGPVTGIDSAAGRIYLAAGRGGITVLETAAGGALRWLGSFRSGTEFKAIEVDDGRAIATTGDGHLVELDVVNPEAIRVTARLTRRCCAAAHNRGDSALVVADNRLIGYDLTSRAPQSGNLGLAVGQGVNFGGQRRVDIERDIAYVADWFAGLHLYSLVDPQRPRLLSSLPTAGSAKGIVVRDGIAYVADDDHGLQVIDVRDPRRPQRLAGLALPGLAYTPVLDGDRLWLAVHHGGIVAVDIADPQNPVLLNHYETPGKAWSLRVRDGIAYVAADEAGLLLIDIGDIDQPRLLGAYRPGDRVEEVLLDGGQAYVAVYDSGVHIIDVGTPEAPRKLGTVVTPGNARGLDLQGDRLYVADWRAGIQVIDVSDPQRPRITGSSNTDGAAWGVRLWNDRFGFVADWWGGISIVDVSDGRRPRIVGRYPQHVPIKAVAAAGRYAFVAQGDAGLQVFDIDNPLNPTWVTGLELPDARRAVVIGQKLYVLYDTARIAALDIGNPGRPRITGRLSAPAGIRDLQPAGQRLLSVEENSVTLIDPERDLRSRFVAGTRIHDAWYDARRVFIATGSGLLRLDAGSELADNAVTLASGAYHRVRAWRGIIAAVMQDGDILILEDGAEPRELARIPLADGVVDMLPDADMLHVATDRSGIMALDLHDPGRWRIRTYQQTIDDITAIHRHRDAFYLAGSPQLQAVAALPVADVAIADRGMVTVHLPEGLPAGAYDLAGGGESLPGAVVRYDAVNIEPLQFGKPQLSSEEFEQLQRQHLERSR